TEKEDVGKLKDTLRFLKAGPTLWIATEKGLFQWRKTWDKPRKVGLPVGAVKSLVRSPTDGPIWVVGTEGVFRIAGADSTDWPARIAFTGLLSERFTDETISAEWTIGDYGWRTKPAPVR